MASQQKPVELEGVRHPGEQVLEYLEFYGWSQRDLARRAGLTPKTISEICNGKAPISPPTALAFEKVLERPAHFWLGLQRKFDEAVARRYELSLLADWEDWQHRFPLKEMKRLDYTLPPGRSNTDVLLNFFGVSSPESWNSVWKASGVAYRQTRRFKTKEESVAAWVREAELIAREFDFVEFDERRLRSSLPELRKLTRNRVAATIDPVQELCSAAGVAVVWVPELPNTGISGCTRWVSDTRVLVALTLRYKTDDQMWFTLFHELGHVLLHKNKRSFVIDNAAEDLTDRIVDPEMQQYEAEANRFAADTLIPARALSEFIRGETFTNESIHEFAESEGIGPGIVVGRLQHDGVLEPHQGNTLKQKLAWKSTGED
ncbi:MAG TPA: HigA family addiction module antitoxin [Gemmatimonadaceae bacterium]|nr:HigA family addiction module antitoxin [Gemmatimonadaceae bacterium]